MPGTSETRGRPDARMRPRIGITARRHEQPTPRVVTARGGGGFIEAVEASGAWPAYDVQWHPETMSGPAEMAGEQALFRHSIARAAAYAARHS